MFRPGATPDHAAGIQNVDPVDTFPEAAVLVMVLAMHVGGDHAAQRDEFGAWGDGWEPASGQKG